MESEGSSVLVIGGRGRIQGWREGSCRRARRWGRDGRDCAYDWREGMNGTDGSEGGDDDDEAGDEREKT